MADIMRWDPFREALSLHDAMDRLFQESFVLPSVWPSRREMAGTLPIDMYETDNEVVVKASIPGMDPKDASITVTGNVLNIKGETKQESEGERGTYHYRERRYGSFERSISLPTEVNADKAEATFEKGVLTLHLPKAEEVKPKQVTVKAK
jgi:HSP20 family protein